MYKVCFPLTIEGKPKIAIFPDECGLVNNRVWHPILQREFYNPLNALVLAEDIRDATKKNRDCPCGESCKSLATPLTVYQPEEDEEDIHLD